MPDFFEDVQTGMPEHTLDILGRPFAGTKERYVFLEEPGPSIWMHFAAGNKLVHYKRDCPHCEGNEPPKPYWFVGGVTLDAQRYGPIELTVRCYRSAECGARRIGTSENEVAAFDVPKAPVFTGLLVEISRANFASSPRVLRVIQRVTVTKPWQHDTRRELARIWNIPVKPRLYKEG